MLPNTRRMLRIGKGHLLRILPGAVQLVVQRFVLTRSVIGARLQSSGSAVELCGEDLPMRCRILRLYSRTLPEEERALLPHQLTIIL